MGKKKKVDPITVVCVKVGDKYDATYVNILQRMVERNLTVPHRFVCITDDPKGLYCDTVEAMYSRGWWTKLSLFAPNCYDFTGKILYLDLDIVIRDNINKLATYDASFAISRDWTCSKYNSSVMLLDVGTETQIWDFYNADRIGAEKSVPDGDQGIIGEHSEPSVFPERWISSYKVHCRGIGEPVSPIVLFHGRPNPSEVLDDWVTENWR